MKNPLQDINIFRVETGEDHKQGKTDVLIVTAYSKSGVVNAFYGYSEKVIGKATGGGYDKTHSALASAISSLYSVQVESNMAGFEAVKESAAKAGITLTRALD